MMADHSQEECTLNPSRATPVVQVQDAGRRGRRKPAEGSGNVAEESGWAMQEY